MKYNIIWLVIFLLLTIGCQKKTDIGYKKKVIALLDTIESSNIKNSAKISTFGYFESIFIKT